MWPRHSRTVRSLRDLVPATPATYLVAATSVGVLAWVSAHGSPTDVATLVRYGALERGRVSSGEPWRLVTAAFVHVGWVHLAWNLAAGIPWCRPLERFLGPRRFLLVYLASAVGASAVSVLGHDVVSAGASGALFGVVGATLALHRRALGSWRAFLGSGPARRVVVSIAIFSAAGAALGAPLDHLAHAGGLAVGAAAAWLLSAPPPGAPATLGGARGGLAAQRAGRAALAAALGAAVLAASWPRATLSRFAAAELRRDAAAALRAGDFDAARRLVARGEAGHDGSERLRFYRALLLEQDGDLAGALAATRAIRGDGDPDLRADAGALRIRAARGLAYRHASGDGAPRDAGLALSYMEAACALGDERSCRDAAAMSGR